MRYVWPGNISLDVPAGWQVKEPGDLIELVPSSGRGAMHVSILDRERSEAPTEQEARELAEWFRDRRGGDGEIVVAIEPDRLPSARTSFTVAEDGVPMSWTVYTKIWPERAILASFSSEPGFAKDLGEANTIFKSLQIAD
ncbi:MAG TPA: hypothetical protein VGM13_15035 [Thermoanaerobaculia bacterium]|jgi:hypothetical protein